ncbi:hypothetical protein V8D89_002271 [Ganoderma adspersum]
MSTRPPPLSPSTPTLPGRRSPRARLPVKCNCHLGLPPHSLLHLHLLPIERPSTMAMERPQYARIESVYGSAPASVSTSVTAPPTSTPGAPRTLRHKVSRAFSTLTRRDPSSPERERGPTPPLPTPAALSPATETETETDTEKTKDRQSQNALKRTWGRRVAIARARSEPALRAKRAKAAAAVLVQAPPAKPSRSAPVTTHSRDVNAYVPSEGAVVSYTYPLWRIDPVLVGCFVCL